ncbi:DUF3995 domain-containing protein [Embleya sp. NBC_00896]|uniref:DUF3995 domain-containing protein n=1 Tax=Embleya sp. NBC_00896 TaxID=2975961 RepID=UPI002F90AC28|nr:DUF3995 domain-containing protein [Embleya sp. NBC_00896]
MWRKVVGVSVGAVLAAIGVQHMVWEFTPWPFSSEDEWASHLLGSESARVPAPLSFLVGSGLVVSGYLPLASARLAPEIGPPWVYRLGTWGLAATLLLRGLGGPLLNSGTTEVHTHWNLWLYSPLCVALGAGIVAVAPRLDLGTLRRDASS